MLLQLYNQMTTEEGKTNTHEWLVVFRDIGRHSVVFAVFYVVLTRLILAQCLMKLPLFQAQIDLILNLLSWNHTNKLHKRNPKTKCVEEDFQRSALC